MELPLTNDFRSIVLNNYPLIDVRAPIEFEKGAFFNAKNLPLLNDKERQAIGICYKKHGNKKAVELGHKLIQGSVKKERVTAWKDFISDNKNIYLYCFRGGQRSKISQMWLNDIDINITRLKGGYKAFRNYLMLETQRITSEIDTIIIGGRTGSGKTLLLNKLDNTIDLEGLANHRGSSFGSFVTKQPSQIDFENNLSYKLIQMETLKPKNLIIEHESQNIGRCFIPKQIYQNFIAGKLIILETPFETRVNIIHDEYVTSAIDSYYQHFKDEGASLWAENIKSGLNRIKKRLGSQQHLELINIFDYAFKQQLINGDIQSHKEWIRILLKNYYDPMYDYQIQKSPIPIIFKGDKKAVFDFIQEKESKI